MRRAIVALALLTAACKSPSPPSSFGVDVTLDAAALSSSVRAQIVSAALSVTGDETYMRTFAVGSVIAGGQVRFRYVPGIHSGTLTLAINALASDGSVVASTEPATVTLSPGHAVAAMLVLGSPIVVADDMGSGDDGGVLTCEPGFHECTGACADDRSVDSCGSSCTSCPVGANASAATCDGTSCGLQCNSGYHLCGGACVSSASPDSCNMSCTPCTAPTGGTATCDATACGGSCPSDQKLCFGVCIPMNMACNGSCPSGTHDCNGLCSDDGSVNSCGTSCTPCAVPANAMNATCTGGACGFVCNSGYKQCGSKCIPSTACCTTADCTQPANGTATCDTSTNQCVIACNSGYTKCGNQCIPAGSCCSSADCPQPTNGAATCNASHMCIDSCNTAGNTVCNNACVDTTTDNNNCGGCGIKCGGQCALSRCVVVLASGQHWPQPIAVDATTVYWGNAAVQTSDEALNAVPIAGGTPTTLAGGKPFHLLVLYGTSLYFGGGDLALQGIWAMPKSGGTVTTLVGASVAGLALDSARIYFSDYTSSTTTWSIASVPLGGGTVTTLASGGITGPIAVYGNFVYWADTHSGGISRTPTTGGTSVLVTSSLASSLAIDGTNLYWTYPGTSGAADGAVMKMPLSGGTPTTLASGQKASPSNLLVDGGATLYWVNGDYSIMKVSVTGGTPIRIAVGDTPGSVSGTEIAVDGTSLYFTAVSNGTVSKVTPK